MTLCFRPAAFKFFEGDEVENKYRHLLKARSKALSIFEKAKADLANLDVQFAKEEDNCAQSIEDLQFLIEETRARISAEYEAISYLKSGREKNRETIEKIAAVTA